MDFRRLALLTVFAILFGCGTRPKIEAKQQPKAHPPGEIVAAGRIRDICPVRMGFVGNKGIGDNSHADEDSAKLGIQLGPENIKWIATHLDVAAFDARCLTPGTPGKPGTFEQIRQTQHLFTGLLKADASALYEQEGQPGNVGGWKPAMVKWTLRDKSGVEVKHPDPGGHWMDFGSTEWAEHWFKQVHALATAYRATGVLAEKIPIGNTFVEASLLKYPRTIDRVDASSRWLSVVHRPDQFLLVVSGVGFDDLIGRATLPVSNRRAEKDLSGRGWDEFDSVIDGAWAEGWIQPYWLDATVSEKEWEIQIEAAERAAINDNVFVASFAYHNADELEFGIASYLLAAHRQGRLCLQPMPIQPGESSTAGCSLAVLKAEYNRYQKYFDVPLGYTTEERHEIIVGGNGVEYDREQENSDSKNLKQRLVPAEGKRVWKRAFDKGVVYVNSHDHETLSIPLGGEMLTLKGEKVRGVNLGPHSGIILLYPPKEIANATK